MIELNCLLWGLFIRSFGFIYLFSFTSILVQLKVLYKITPPTKWLNAAKRDMSWKCYFRFPTFCWIDSSEKSLQFQCLLGIFSSISIMYGYQTQISFILCYTMYLSLATSLIEFICYPWDNLLLESGFLMFFLPSILPLHEGISSTNFPLPAVTLLFWWVQFHFVLGMGKRKYFHHSGDIWKRLFLWIKHFDYIKWYLMWQPIPSALAYYMFLFPMWFHHLVHVAHFIDEIIFPFLFFAPTPIRYTVNVLNAILMLGILFCGNFGLFPPLGFVLCLPIFDPRSFTELFFAIFTPNSFFEIIVNFVIFPIIVFGGIINLNFCFWSNNYWMYCKDIIDLSEKNSIIKSIVDFYRFLHPFHIMNAYGVFFVETLYERNCYVIMGSDDKIEWKEYKLKYLPTSQDAQPRALFGYQPRVDQTFFYMGYERFFSNYNNPYFSYGNRWFYHFLKLVSQNDKDVKTLFREFPFDSRPPNHMKVIKRTIEFEYNSNEFWFKENKNEEDVISNVKNVMIQSIFHPSLFESPFFQKEMGVKVE
jgi:hypothetical protein